MMLAQFDAHRAKTSNAIAIDEIHELYEAGADYVYLNRFEAAWTLQRAIGAGQHDHHRDRDQ